MTSFMNCVSNSNTEIGLSVPAGLLITGYLSKDSLMVKKSGYMLEVIAVGSAISFILKYIFNRPRPSTQDSLIIPESDMGSPSFPSGHASFAFAAAVSLSMAYSHWHMIVLSYLWACTV